MPGEYGLGGSEGGMGMPGSGFSMGGGGLGGMGNRGMGGGMGMGGMPGPRMMGGGGDGGAPSRAIFINQLPANTTYEELCDSGVRPVHAKLILSNLGSKGYATPLQQQQVRVGTKNRWPADCTRRRRTVHHQRALSHTRSHATTTGEWRREWHRGDGLLVHVPRALEAAELV